MTRRYRTTTATPALLALCALMAGLPATAAPKASTQPAIERTQWNGQPALRLSNGVADVVVVPSISRIIRFGFAGGRNLLWINHTDKLHNFGVWTNWGGSRTWLGAENRWAMIAGPKGPDPVWADRPARVVRASQGHIVLATQRSRLTGIRIVRDISFDARGRLIIDQSLDKQGGAPVDVDIWQVTQIAPPDSIEMPVRPDSPYKNSYYSICGDTASFVQPLSPSSIALKHSSTGDYKVGADAPVASLTAILGDVRLTVAGQKVDGTYPDGAVGHGFPVEIWNSGVKDGDYNELEMLSPIQVLKSGGTYHYTLTWTLSRENSVTH
ncbi:MAG: hypothetical protein P4L33_18925 [Capsulimonadaceae bacterium]|nr:hypothetical protein [Capsulimonadaceae bacterium]